MELKEAIEMVSEACYHYDRELYENCNYSEAFDTVLEELDKLRKENKNLKAENRILSVKLAEYFSDNNLCEKGCKYYESEEDKE